MRVIATIAALLVLAPGVCLADGNFRCGNYLVSADESVAGLVKKCGQPASRDVSTQDVHNDRGVKIATSTTEVWHYEQMVVTIVDGQIQSIDRAR